jgi:hypothetical protein
VFGLSTANEGVVGWTGGSGGAGVQGANQAASGSGGSGGYFSSATTGSGFGVYGTATATSNTGYAGYFTNSDTGAVSYGVYGASASYSGYGGYFTNTGTCGGCGGVALTAYTNPNGNNGTGSALVAVFQAAVQGPQIELLGSDRSVVLTTNGEADGLQVIGNIDINVTAPNVLRFDNYNNTIGYGSIGIDASNNLVLTQSDSAYILLSGGNVGIGTTSPSQTLQVNGTAFVGNSYSGNSTGADFEVEASGHSPYESIVSASNATLSIGVNGTNGPIVGWDNGSLTFRSGITWTSFPSTGNALMTITNGGNVGIGTTSPTAPLDVAGAIRSEADSYVSSDFSKTSSTALAAITGLTSGTLAAGKAYAFDIWLYTTSSASGGIKVDLNGGTATVTTLIGDSQEWDGTAIGVRTAFSSLSTALCAITAVATATCHITGTIIVNAAGTLKPEFAQNASNGTASKVKTGSVMLIRQLN